MSAQIGSLGLDDILDGACGPATPGVVVGVACEGEVIYRGCRGLTDIRLDHPLTATTPMPIGSATKQFTCLALMLLAENDAIDLEVPVRRYLPWLNSSFGDICVRLLMSHMSGLRDAYDIAQFFGDPTARCTTGDALCLYRTIDALNAQPQARWQYNNGAYLILGALIEHQSRKHLEAFFREAVFEPLGMHDTALYRWDENAPNTTATPHLMTGDGVFKPSCRAIEGGAQGGIYSSLDDLLRWQAQFAHPTIGSTETWSRMRTRQRTRSGVKVDYGFGLFVRGGEAPAIFHPGGVVGASCQVLSMPDRRLDVVAISNRSDVSAMDIADKVLTRLRAKATRWLTPAAQIDAAFHCPTGRLVRLLTRGQRQCVEIDSFDLGEIVMDADGRWHTNYALGAGPITLKPKGTQGDVMALQLDDCDEHLELFRLVPPPTQAQARNGTYRCKPCEIDLVLHGPQQRASATSRFGVSEFLVEWLSEHVAFLRKTGPFAMNGFVHVREDYVTVSTSRTRALRFDRLVE